MMGHLEGSARKLRLGACRFVFVALAGLAIGACNQSGSTTADAAKGDPKVTPPGGHPLSEATNLAEEYGEFVAKPEELTQVPVNDIVKSIRLNAIAMLTGEKIYQAQCSACHGEDLKGSKAAHAPDLTDDDWRFSGDDLPSGGLIKYPSDVEWTVRYGVRSGNQYARGVEADMLAFDPQYRNQHDLMDYGMIRTLTDDEMKDVAEYVLKIGGQQNDAAMAMRGETLFFDNAKGNCIDCHTDEATGNPALGSTNLTQPKLYLWGSDRASILESIIKGRAGMMPSFEKTLTAEELKAVSIYVWSRAAKEELPPGAR